MISIGNFENNPMFRITNSFFKQLQNPEIFNLPMAEIRM